MYCKILQCTEAMDATAVNLRVFARLGDSAIPIDNLVSHELAEFSLPAFRERSALQLPLEAHCTQLANAIRFEEILGFCNIGRLQSLPRSAGFFSHLLCLLML